MKLSNQKGFVFFVAVIYAAVIGIAATAGYLVTKTAAKQVPALAESAK